MISKDILQAIDILKSGDVIGLPTETVYGLAADITDPAAIKKIFKTKERPFFDPLIVHVSSIEQAKSLTIQWSPGLQKLAEAFWPGPLTLLIKKNPVMVNEMITSGLERVGVRWPNHPLAEAVIRAVGPLAAPSANKFGKTSPTQAVHVESEFAQENIFILDGGASDVGIESTVLWVDHLSDGKMLLNILRPGRVKASDISSALHGMSFEFTEVTLKQESPGQMKHHYMPSVPLIIVRDQTQSREQIIKLVKEAMSSMPDEVEHVKIIKPKSEIQSIYELKLAVQPEAAARELYAHLRAAGEAKPDLILFYRQDYHQGEAWEALFERLNKAASLII